jgi:sarcosine oxidase
LRAQVERAFDEGGTIHARERVRDWSATTQGVVVETDRRQYTADKLVVTAGAWSSKLLQIVEGRAQPERQVLGWFQPPNPEAFAPERFPVFTLDVDEGEFYGFPIFGVPGFKIGRHHHRHQETDPDEMNREPTREDERLLRRFVEKYFPSAAGPTMRLETCLYTNSPDEQFIIDTHPDHSNVVLAAGFSGHGFKFSTVVGEILADLAIDGDTDHEIELFRLDRF